MINMQIPVEEYVQGLVDLIIVYTKLKKNYVERLFLDILKGMLNERCNI